MSVLTAMQSAAARLEGRRPTAFFASQETFEVELSDLSTETAVAIMKYHDWRKLTKKHTLTGDGTTTEFDLPEDYDRMLVKGDVHSTTWSLYRFTRVFDLDEWEDFHNIMPAGVPGAWIMLGGKIHIYPAMASGEEAVFYYVSNSIAYNEAAVEYKAAFTTDDDVFQLDERLLTLGLIWRWRAQKKLEYAEDMRNYEIALSEAVARDKGSRMIAPPRSRGGFSDLRLAYPRPLGA